MSSPSAPKRARSPSPDEFDEFDTSADDLIRAVEETEAKKPRVASPRPPQQTTLAPKVKPTASSDVPVYTHPYAGTKDDPWLLERTTMNSAWFQRLEPAMRQDSFLKLKAFLDVEKKAGKTIYPPPHLIYNWSRMTPLETIKVVIVGQDPYHQPGQACGLSFSVPMGKAVPASLQNIYKELKAEYPDFVAPKHGCLDGWARQGVLLLNACLTVTAGAAGSHHNRGWEPFTKEILKSVLKAASGTGGGPLASMFAHQKQDQSASAGGPHKGVVFLAWGLPAAKTLADAGITEKTPNVLLLKSPHPSPLSAHRGFLGNGHFAKANAWLEEPTRYGKGGGIRWNDL